MRPAWRGHGPGGMAYRGTSMPPSVRSGPARALVFFPRTSNLICRACSMPPILPPGEGRESWGHGGKSGGTAGGGAPQRAGAGEAAARAEQREAGRPRAKDARRPGREGPMWGGRPG